MKLFIRRLALYTVSVLVIFECVIRLTHMTIDIPFRTINSHGIQLYIPNQTGYWRGGTHSWTINSDGWPGILPSKSEDLITIIGDSHIENFMNPDSCHLAPLLQKQFPNENFYEAGRSGVTMIEALEIADYIAHQFDVKKHLIFIKDSDITESIAEFRRREDMTQFSVESGELLRGKLKAPILKRVLYNVKLLYFVREIWLQKVSRGITKSKEQKHYFSLDNPNVTQFLSFLDYYYTLDNCVFFLHPESSKALEEIFIEREWDYYKFNSANPETWRYSKTDANHWSCEGFTQATAQIQQYLTLNEIVNEINSK